MSGSRVARIDRAGGAGVLVAATVLALVAMLVITRPPAVAEGPEPSWQAQRFAAAQAVHPQAVAVDRDLERVAGEDVIAALDAVADRSDARTFGAGLALFLGRQGVLASATGAVEPDTAGAPSYQQTPVPTPPQPGVTEDSGQAGSTIAFTGPALVAGDLSGDGLDDVVTTAGGAGGTELAAVRGSDGTTLWRDLVAADPDVGVWAALQAVGDLTGDGADDVLVSLQRFEPPPEGGSGACTATGCTFSDRFTWEVQLRDGPTGAVVWSRTHEGRNTYEEQFGAGQTYRYAYEAVNPVVPYVPLQDVTGDGVGDLLVTLTRESYADERTVEGRYPGPVTETSSSGGTAATTLQVVSGIDGAVVESLVEPEGDTALGARPVPDVTGDGISDVLVNRRGIGRSERTCVTEGTSRTCTEEGDVGGLEVELLDAPDLSSRWTTSFPLREGGASSPGDLTGDGTRDVLVQASTTTGQGVLAVLSSGDGGEVWSAVTEPGPFGGEASVAVTPLEADGAQDLLGVRTALTEGGSPYVEVVRRDGATGEELLVTAHGLPPEGEDSASYAFVAGTADADGDGSEDVQIVIERFEADTYSSTTVVESGRTGEVLATLPSTGPHGRFYVPAGDLDGDGGVDAIAFSDGIPSEEGAEVPATTAVRLRDGSVLWEQPAGPGGSYTYGAQPAQLDGDVGGDVVVFRERFAQAFSASQVVGIDGEDGAELWVAPPPPEIRRAEGGDRIATAAAVSASVFAAADVVVLARADDFPDALAGGPLATALDGPLLLTAGNALDVRTAEEITRLGATSAVLMGGTAALGDQVAADLQARGLVVDRIAGDDRYATAALAAARIVELAEGVDRVALAAGGQGVPDGGGWIEAILAAAYGAGTGVPLLLLTADAVPAATAEALQRLAPEDGSLLVGDGAAVSAEVEQQVRDLTGAPTERLARPTPAHLAAAVASFAIRDGASPASLWVATATRFPDALSAAGAVGATGGVLLLTDGSGEADGWLLDFLATYGPAVRAVTVVGGPAAVPATTTDALEEAVDPPR